MSWQICKIKKVLVKLRVLIPIVMGIGWNAFLLSTDFMYDLTRLANPKGKMMEIDPQLSERKLGL